MIEAYLNLLGPALVDDTTKPVARAVPGMELLQ